MKNITFLVTCLLLLFAVSFGQHIEKKSTVSAAEHNDLKRFDGKVVAFRLQSSGKPVTLPVNAHSVNGQMLYLDVKEFDLGNDVTESVFTAPEEGIYHLDVRLNLTYADSDKTAFDRFILLLHKNWQPVEKTELVNPAAGKNTAYTMAISTTLMLKKGDAVAVYFRADARSGNKELMATAISFSGFKVSTISGGE
jgi:hypothetical protein